MAPVNEIVWRWFATSAKIAWIAVAKCAACLPLRNLQAVDITAIGETGPFSSIQGKSIG
jgi:hypothetical protein